MANALAWVSQSIVNYILQQDFESSGTPAGWSSFGTGTTFHNTTSPLEGTGDLKVLGGPTPNRAIGTWTPSVSDCWIVALLKLVSLPSSGTSRWCMLNASFSPVSGIRIATTGLISCVHGGSIFNMATAAVAGTLYYFKSHYKSGTGADGIGSWELSTSGTWIGSGGLFQSTTTGTGTAFANQVDCIYEIDGESRYDHIRISSTDLGNSFSNWV